MAAIQALLLFGVVITALAYMVHPPTGRSIAKRFGKGALAVFAANAALGYVWSDGIGRIILIGIALFVVVSILRARQ